MIRILFDPHRYVFEAPISNTIKLKNYHTLRPSMEPEKESCHRCGKTRTPHRLENRPTCGPCQAQLHAIKEKRFACPVDGTRLEKHILEKRIVIDKCPKCQGVWLDPGELEVIQELSKQKPDHQDWLTAHLIGRQYGF